MSLSTADVDTSHDTSHDVTPQAAQCEVLCFIRQKCKLMAFDDIAKVCVDYYREDEVSAAKAVLEQALSYRLPKRQGANKCRAIIEDMIKVCLDPKISLPIYYAVDLNRIPPCLLYTSDAADE